MSKEIKGNIEYSLTISDDGKWDIKYGSTIHNDMASLAIAQYVMESIAVNLREEKNNASGKVKKAYAAKLDKAISGRFGVQVICDYMLDNYIPYMKYLEEAETKRDVIANIPPELDKRPLTADEVASKSWDGCEDKMSL